MRLHGTVLKCLSTESILPEPLDKRPSACVSAPPIFTTAHHRKHGKYKDIPLAEKRNCDKLLILLLNP
jgi:hypothetical protein